MEWTVAVVLLLQQVYLIKEMVKLGISPFYKCYNLILRYVH